MTTPNLLLNYPSVLVTPGPAYASLINACFDTLDAHDHSSDKGVAVTPAGLNINRDLSMAGNNLTTIRTLRLASQPSTPTGVGDLYILYANGNELCYRDGTGTEVPITSAGAIAGTPGSISNLGTSGSAGSYSSITKSLTFTYASSSPMRLNIGDILLYPYDGTNSYSTPITLKTPTSTGAAYSLTLPAAVPSQASILSMDTSGTLTTGLANGTVSAPGLSFASDLGTGLYRVSAATLGIALGGTQGARFTAAGINLPVAGSTSAASLAFGGEADLGFYQVSSDVIAFTAAGTGSASLGPTGISLNTSAVTAPALAFGATGGTTGVYSPTSGQMAIAASGSQAILFKSTGSYAPNGSAAAPTYSFANGTGTGTYLIPADSNSFNIAVGGSQKVEVDTTALTSYVPMQVGGSSNGKFNVKVFTGNIVNNDTISLDSGGTQVIGAFGVWSASNLVLALGNESGEVNFTTADNAHSIGVSNNGVGSTQPYRVVVFYQ